MIAKNVEPLVNIIMPVYNAKEYIADAITSIVSQLITISGGLLLMVDLMMAVEASAMNLLQKIVV